MFEQRPGQGVLFPNDQRGNEKAPTHRGELKLEDGRVISLAGWRKEGRNGSFLSLKIEGPREQHIPEPAASAGPGPRRDAMSAQHQSRHYSERRTGRYDDDPDSPF